jgi:hypothetical protein
VAISPMHAAGIPPISTVGQPGGRIGPPTCGIGTTAGVCIGHVCISPTLAAGGISDSPFICYFQLINQIKDIRKWQVLFLGFFIAIFILPRCLHISGNSGDYTSKSQFWWLVLHDRCIFGFGLAGECNVNGLRSDSPRRKSFGIFG